MVTVADVYAVSDDEQHNHQFDQANAGASLTFPMQCSALRKNGHVVIKVRNSELALCMRG